MKKHIYIIITLLFLSSNFIFAQQNKNSTMVDQMHSKKWQYLVERSGLTAQEVQKVEPVFMEYEKEIWKHHAKNIESFKKARNKDMNEQPNYAELNDRYVNAELIQAQLFKNYHLKLNKLLSPETLYKYYKAERDFKRKLLQDYPSHSKSGDKQ